MLAEKINKDYIQAMKSKESLKASTLSFLRAQMKNVMIDQKLDSLEDADVIVVLKKQVKQRQDSIEQYTKGGRQDLAGKEQQELVILRGYLPEEMTEEQLEPIIDAAILEAAAQSMKDMGNVMKVLLPKLAGRSDNKLTSSLVKQALANLGKKT